MPEPEKDPIVVIGAAGYVGQEVVRRLISVGLPVAVATRPNSAFLLERLGAELIPVDSVDGRRTFRRVINLAYPNGWPVYRRGRENRQIADLVENLAAPGARVLHVSSLAVFGFELDQPIMPGPIPVGHDFEYVESKRWIEHRLAARLEDRELHIVRLGNVWGPASPNWVVGLVECLRAGQPLLINGQTGASNLTDVANVADYLSHLMTIPCSGPALRFHHLAEFSAHPWSVPIKFLADELGLEIKSIPKLPEAEAANLGEDLRQALHVLLAGSLNGFRNFKESRLGGSHVRRVLENLPDGLLEQLKRLKGSAAGEPAQPVSDANLLRVLNPRQEFKSVTLAGWTPPVTLTESMDRVSRWLSQAGYR
jgi:nucleoside-diphosphate-sugar epimerase